MAKVPLPDRGQPLDLSYIYQLAEAINNLSNQLSPVNAKYTTIDTIGNGKQTVRTSDARVVGGFIAVNNTSTNTPGAEQEFKYDFSDFAYTPIVTASPRITDSANTQASKDVTVVLTDVTSKSVSGIVRFNTAGVASVGVNLIIIGITV
jgi:hypothetical protein